MDLGDDDSVSSSLTNLEADSLGKKRKHCNMALASTNYTQDTLFKAYNNISVDGKVSLVILKQPEKQHRARYHTEGSRGAVKDRGQNGFPTVQLRNYQNLKNTAVLQVFVGSDTGTPIPHLYYQACKVSGKNSTPCREMKKENTDVILIDMEPDKDRIVVCDCVGILKERHSDIEGKVPPNKRVNWKKKTTKCRIVFRTEIENDNGDPEILQIVTDTISCTQLPGTPEILKMSMTSGSIEGGEELWIIGKNFLKDTEVIFKEEETLWSEKVKPIKEFFSNNHLIVVVPPYKDPNSSESVVVNISVKCGSKTSEPRPLMLKPALPVVKLNGSIAVVNLTNGGTNMIMAMPAAACKEEPIINPRPTILEQIEEHTPGAAVKNVQVVTQLPHVSRVSKKRRERKTPFSRAREQPDINADEAMFDTVDSSSTSLDRGVVNWSALLSRHSRQTSADRIQEHKPSCITSYRQQLLIPDDTITNFNNQTTEATSTTNFMEDTSNQQVPVVVSDTTVTSPTAHFENLSFKQPGQDQLDHVPRTTLSFAGISKTGFKQTYSTVTTQAAGGVGAGGGQPVFKQTYSTVTAQAAGGGAGGGQPVAQTVLRGATVVETVAPTQPVPTTADFVYATPANPVGVAPNEVAPPQTAPNVPQTSNETKHENSCSLGIDNSGTESATISIKLPPSVLQDQKQLSTIVNTISKALHPHQGADQETINNNNENNVQSPNTFSPAEIKQDNSTVSPQSYANNATWQQPPSDLVQDPSPWIATDDNGFEKKRKRVAETAEFNQATEQEWNTQALEAPVAVVEAAWNTQNQAWVTSSTVQDLTSTWTTDTVQSAETKLATTVSSIKTSSGQGWTTNTGFVVTNGANDNSDDSGNCTKWENINAKPLDPWSDSTPVNKAEMNTYLNTNHTWTSNGQPEVVNTTWTDAKPWPTTSDLQVHQQPMDSTAAVVVNSTSSGVVSPEMMPVNPKEVSPMDVDTTSATSTLTNNPLFVTTTNSLSSTHVDSKMIPVVVVASTVVSSADASALNNTNNGTVDLITYNT